MSNPGGNYPKREIDLGQRATIPQYVHNTPVKNEESGWTTVPKDTNYPGVETLGLYRRLFLSAWSDRAIAWRFSDFPKERR